MFKLFVLVVDGGASLFDELMRGGQFVLLRGHLLLEALDLAVEGCPLGVHVELFLLQVIKLLLVVLGLEFDAVVVFLRYLGGAELRLPGLDLSHALLVQVLDLAVLLDESLHFLLLVLDPVLEDTDFGLEGRLRTTCMISGDTFSAAYLMSRSVRWSTCIFWRFSIWSLSSSICAFSSMSVSMSRSLKSWHSSFI